MNRYSKTERVIPLLVLLALAQCTAGAFDMVREPAVTTSNPRDLWLFLPIGYLFTIAIETPVLLIGLSKDLSFRKRLFAGIWLTACTYPIVVLVLPVVFADAPRALYLLVAEVFAPVAECLLFWLAFRRDVNWSRGRWIRNLAVVVLANILSFSIGEILNSVRWFGLF
jgi:hypothetical protein